MEDTVGHAIVKEKHTIKKRILPKNKVFSAEQTNRRKEADTKY
jgi:hypothetical protein